jgi:tetratricopeptide (TPR) repeat protein
MMSTLAQPRLALPLLLACLLLVWAAAGARPLAGALARNAGFLAFNDARSDEPADEAKAARSAAYLERATGWNGANPSAWRALGYLRLWQGAEDEALAAWRQSGTMAAELLANGATAEASGDSQLALQWYERAMAVAPTNAEGWLRAGAIHEHLGNTNDAIAFYREASATLPDNSDLLYRLGEIYSQQPEPVDWKAVLTLAEQSIAHDNFLHDWSQLRSHYLRGESLRQLGREREALEEFAATLARWPNDQWTLIRFGELSWQVAGDLEKATAALERAIANDPANKWAYLFLARIYDEAGQSDKAGALYARVLEIDPDDWTAKQWLAQP